MLFVDQMKYSVDVGLSRRAVTDLRLTSLSLIPFQLDFKGLPYHSLFIFQFLISTDQ